MLLSSQGKHPWSRGSIGGTACKLDSGSHVLIQRTHSFLVHGQCTFLQGVCRGTIYGRRKREKSCTAHLHFLKAESQGTASQPPSHEAAREEDGRAARGAVIVAVGNGDPCQPHLIESTLTAGGAAKDIPHILCRRRRGRSKD